MAHERAIKMDRFRREQAIPLDERDRHRDEKTIIPVTEERPVKDKQVPLTPEQVKRVFEEQQRRTRQRDKDKGNN